MSQANTFKYLALDAMGKKTKGQVTAASEHVAYREIAAQGLTPVRIAEGKVTRSRGGIKATDITTLTRELSVLVQAKIPIATGLVSVAENESNAELARMTREIAAAIESGEKITEAFGRYRDVFGDVFIETMRAAEATGSLGEASGHLADMLDRNQEMRKQLKRALSYPVIVIGFVMLALTVIVLFVVPKFAEIFAQNGVALPITTRVVQFIGESVKSYWYVCLGGIVATVMTFMMAWRSSAGRHFFERLFLRIPCFGSMIVAMTAARFTRVLGLSLGAGLDLPESIAMAGRATGRPVFVEETARMSERMRGGASLSEVLRDSKYLPSFARRMLSAGKDSKELANSSSIIASHYDREADHLARSVNTLIEPIMTISLAGIVLLVALSVFLPMWQMIKISHG